MLFSEIPVIKPEFLSRVIAHLLDSRRRMPGQLLLRFQPPLDMRLVFRKISRRSGKIVRPLKLLGEYQKTRREQKKPREVPLVWKWMGLPAARRWIC